MRISCNLATRSFLINLPDPTCCYADARFLQEQVYHLEDNASCVLVDMFSARSSDGVASWDAIRIKSQISLYMKSKLVIMENVDLKQTELSTIADKVGGEAIVVFGSLILAGPRTLTLQNRLSLLKQRQNWNAHRTALLLQKEDCTTTHLRQQEPLVSVSTLEENLMLVRFHAGSVEDSYKLLSELLRPLESEIGISAYADRLNSNANKKRKFGLFKAFESFDERY